MNVVGVLLHRRRAVEAGVRDREALDRLVDHVADTSGYELARDERARVVQFLVKPYHGGACRRCRNRVAIYGRDVDRSASSVTVRPVIVVI